MKYVVKYVLFETSQVPSVVLLFFFFFFNPLGCVFPDGSV